MNTIVQLRKLCNHPFMFGNIEEALCEHMGLNTTYMTGSVYSRCLILCLPLLTLHVGQSLCQLMHAKIMCACVCIYVCIH